MSARLDTLLTPAQRAACAMHDADYGRPTSHALDPRNDSEGAPATLDEIATEVRDELRASPSLVAHWLEQQCRDTAGEVSVDDVHDMLLAEVPELVACWFAGDNHQSRMASHELRQRFDAWNTAQICDEARRRQELMQPRLDQADADAQPGRFAA